MPRIRPLSPSEAQRTLAHRLRGRVDRLRQFSTNLGVRPYRVFLTWVKWPGEERGEGTPRVAKRQELLPTPKVENIDTMTYYNTSIGQLPLGSIRVSRISAEFTEDELAGRRSGKDEMPDDLEFFYEVVMDGRGDDPAHRDRYKLLSKPFLQAGKVGFTLLLERMGGSDLDRDGTPVEPDC